jgi:hypothetical protein
MASEDGRVVLNPYSQLDPGELDAVALNEAARVFMRRERLTPSFTLTTEQRMAFSNYGPEGAIKETVAARLLSGDPSALEPTEAQIEFVRLLATSMGISSDV